MLLEALETQIDQDVRRALEEDLGSGDITARLIPEDRICEASVYTRDPAILCGRNWFDAVFRQLDDKVNIRWFAADGESIIPAVMFRGAGRALRFEPQDGMKVVLFGHISVYEKRGSYQ